jgi:hypothetical protein
VICGIFAVENVFELERNRTPCLVVRVECLRAVLLVLTGARSAGEALANEFHDEATRKLVSGSCLDPELIIRQNNKLARRVPWPSRQLCRVRLAPLFVCSC